MMQKEELYDDLNRRGFRQNWAMLYLAIALPAAVILSFATQVFRSLDEPAHFLRVVQLSSGSLMPLLGADGHSSGSYQSSGTIMFDHFYGTGYVVYLNSRSQTSIDEIKNLYQIESTGANQFVEHSNTSIYFPTAYLPALVGIIVGRAASDHPLVWFYSARLSSAVVEVGVTTIALSFAESFAPALFVLALMPIVLFQSSAISADAFLIPALILMASISRSVIDRKSLTIGRACLLALLSFIVGTSKFAYAPMILIPLFITLFLERRVNLSAIVLLTSTIIALSVALWWGALMKPLTFTMRLDPGSDLINVNDQLHFVASHPVLFGEAIFRAIIREKGLYLTSFFGAKLGWLDLRSPKILPTLAATALVSNTLFGSRAHFSSSSLVFTCVCALSSFVLIYFFIYLQWNFVGTNLLVGVQGRYFLPLVPLLIVCFPRFQLSLNMQAKLDLFTKLWGLFSTVATIVLVTNRYWIGAF